MKVLSNSREKKKTERFLISHFYWSFSSDIKAVKGLSLLATESLIGQPVMSFASQVHWRTCIIYSTPHRVSTRQRWRSFCRLSTSSCAGLLLLLADMQWYVYMYMYVTNSLIYVQACNGMYVYTCMWQTVIKCCKHAMACVYIHACDKQL